MVLQDFGRYLAFRVERPTRAFVSDLAVLLTAGVVVGVAALAGHTGLTAILVGWLAGLMAGTLTSVRSLAGPLSPIGSGAWWNRHCRNLATKLAFDTVAYMVGVTGSLYALAYVASQRDVGLVRIVQTMFSPVALTVTGLTMWLVPVLANRDPGQAEAVRKRVTLWLGMGCIPLALAAVVIGSPLARLVFGVTDVPGVPALALAAVSATAMAVAAPWVASARVTGHYLPIAWSRAVAAVLTLTGMVTVAALHGATGYLGLLAFQNVTVAVAAVAIGVRTRTSTAATSN
jgi:O-antigen/teichoic acid export membrane protein